MVDARPPDRPCRHPEPGPGPRDGVRPDPVGRARRADRQDRRAPGRYAYHPARRRHRRLVLDHHQRHDPAARRRCRDPARPRPCRRAAGGRACGHRLSRRQLRGRRHRPPRRPVRTRGPQAVRGRRRVRRQDRGLSDGRDGVRGRNRSRDGRRVVSIASFRRSMPASWSIRACWRGRCMAASCMASAMR